MPKHEVLYNDALLLRDGAYEAITEQTSEGLHNMSPTDILELLTAMSRAIEGLTNTVETFYEELNNT